MRAVAPFVALVLFVGCSPAPEPGPTAREWSWSDAVKTSSEGPGSLNHDPKVNANYPQLLAYQDNLYLTWFEEAIGASQIRVAQADLASPDTWSSLDGDGATGLNADTSQPALWSRLFGSGGRLYLSWYEKAADGATSIRIATTPAPPAAVSWTRIEGAATGLRYDPAGKADYPTLEVFSNHLYAAWREGDPGGNYEVRVAVFNGDVASPSWTYVDRGASPGGANRDPAGEGYYPKLLTFNNQLYLMWYELNGYYRTMRCARYNGNDAAPTWTMIDGDTPDGLNFDPHKDAHGPQMLNVDGTLFGLWYERGADITSHVRVVKFDPEKNSWSFVDGATAGGLNRDPTSDGWWPRGVASNAHLTVAWTERSAETYRVRVSDLDTNTATWSVADGGQGLGGDSGAVEYPHMAKLGSQLYLTYSERSGGVLQVRVLKATAP